MKLSAIPLLVALLAIPTVTLSVEAPSPQAIANQFFTILLKRSNDEAVDYFMSLNPKMKGNAEQSRHMKDQVANAVKLYGKPFAVELVSSEDLAPSLKRYVYITKHAYHPLVWEMFFYKPKDAWLPDQIMVVDQYQLIGAKK